MEPSGREIRKNRENCPVGTSSKGDWSVTSTSAPAIAMSIVFPDSLNTKVTCDGNTRRTCTSTPIPLPDLPNGTSHSSLFSVFQFLNIRSEEHTSELQSL